MKGKWTPGPWSYQGGSIESPAGVVVADPWLIDAGGSIEDERVEYVANCHLITAAPALYEALEALAEHADAMEAQNQDYHGLPDGTAGPIRSQTLTEAFAALRLARGEDQ